MTTQDAMYSDEFISACGCKQLVSVLDDGVFKLPPETDGSGNIEYKTKLTEKSDHRTTHLATQLQWRLAEGGGHAIYVVGVHDDGVVVGITEDEFQMTVNTLRDMASQLDNTYVSSIKKRVLSEMDNRVVAEVALTQRNAVLRSELRVTVLGDHNAGKSTVLGCLTYGEADNGRGKARLNLLRHRHEVESGRTSSIALGTIGFDSDDRLLSYANNNSAEQIYQRAQHVVTLIDTCGYYKHLKTTARAITGHSPHVFCVVIAADSESVSATSREYMRIASVLGMPLVVAISKMDMATKAGFGILMHDLLGALAETVPNRSKCIVTSANAGESLAQDMMGLTVVPIFTTSAVRTLGFKELTTVLANARPANTDSSRASTDRPFEFHVEHTYSFDAVGTVVTGWVHAGMVSSGMDQEKKLVIGPDSSGRFTGVDITSIHTLRIPTETAEAGSSAALAIHPHTQTAVTKGMVIIDAKYLGDNGKRRVSDEFIAQVAVLDPDFSTLHSVVVHIRCAYRMARIVEIIDEPADNLGANELSSAPFSCYNVLVRLKFDDGVRDYMHPGMPIVARDGQNLTFAGHIVDLL